MVWNFSGGWFEDIRANFKLNIDSIKGNDNYIWNDDIKLAFQTRNLNQTFKEIVNMCRINNFTIELKIHLSNKNIILFKN